MTAAADTLHRSREWVCGPLRGRIERECVKVGRLLVHANPNGDGFAVTHASTGGQVLVRDAEADAVAAATTIENDHSDALDVLDLLDWGQQLTNRMLCHPAIKRLGEFRKIAARANQDSSK